MQAPNLPTKIIPAKICWIGYWQVYPPPLFREGGWYGWKSSSSSNLSIRVVRADPLIEIGQAVPCRAIRGNSILVNGTLPMCCNVLHSLCCSCQFNDDITQSGSFAQGAGAHGFARMIKIIQSAEKEKHWWTTSSTQCKHNYTRGFGRECVKRTRLHACQFDLRKPNKTERLIM